MKKRIVKSVEMFGSAPIGGYGFRSGLWTAICEDGRKFRFYGSLPHADGLNETRMIQAGQSALDNGNCEFI